jgi:GNAT superfamily N-acetyltransferase
VIDRHTLVAVENDRLVGAAYLKRFGGDDRVSDGYRDAGSIEWLVFDPGRRPAAQALLGEALATLKRWASRRWYADGNLPCLGLYGISDNWPHVQSLFSEAGFSWAGGQVEVIFVGTLDTVAPAGPVPVDGVELTRVVGPLGVSFEAVLRGERIGVFEVEDFYGTGNAALARWADEANHWVLPEFRGQGVGSWLLRHGCQWLRLGGKDRILTYAIESRGPGHDQSAVRAKECGEYYARFGFELLTRTRRGWGRDPE